LNTKKVRGGFGLTASTTLPHFHPLSSPSIDKILPFVKRKIYLTCYKTRSSGYPGLKLPAIVVFLLMKRRDPAHSAG